MKRAMRESFARLLILKLCIYTHIYLTLGSEQEFRKISTYSAMTRWCFSRKDKIIFKNKWLKEIYCKNSEIQGRSLSCSLLSLLPNFLLLLPYFYNLFLILWRVNENELSFVMVNFFCVLKPSKGWRDCTFDKGVECFCYRPGLTS